MRKNSLGIEIEPTPCEFCCFREKEPAFQTEHTDFYGCTVTYNEFGERVWVSFSDGCTFGSDKRL